MRRSKNAYVKSISREIRASFSRFAAIAAIVALGVGFLSGILVAVPDFRQTVDEYYDSRSMSDICLKGSMGLTDGDLAEIKSLDSVEEVMPAYSSDMIVETGDNQKVTARIYGLPLGDGGAINSLELLEGRMPLNDRECLVERDSKYLLKTPVGSVLTVSPDNDGYADIDDTLSVTEFTVVGIVANPYYMGLDREPSNVGDGKLGEIIYLRDSAFALEAYTDFFIRAAGAQELVAFTDEYDSLVSSAKDEIDGISEMRCRIRLHEIKDTAQTRLDEARQDYEDAKARTESELSAAKSELEENERRTELAEEELNRSSGELKRAQAELTARREQFEQSYAPAMEAIAQRQQYADAGREEMRALRQKLDEQSDYIERLRQSAAETPLTAEQQAEIDAYDAESQRYADTVSALDMLEAELNAARRELSAVSEELSAAQDKLNRGRSEIALGRQKISAAKLAIETGWREYEQGSEDAQRELAAAQRRIDKAQRAIDSSAMPKWYLLDRSKNMSSASFKANIDKVSAIATVFPLFFFLIAALVALSTMTRMVEEERIQIGTLKALGYSRAAIASKYAAYCGLATLIGCTIGTLGGLWIIPSVIWSAFSVSYHLPDLIYRFDSQIVFGACGTAALCTMLSTLYACRSAFRERPARLMQPRSPKAGKRVLIEYIPCLWRGMSFSQKATARNLMRNTGNALMTVIGVAGCTALLLTGFGLRDSISDIAQTQYNEIIKYDIIISTPGGKNALPEELLSDDRVIGSAPVMTEQAAGGDDRLDVTVISPIAARDMQSYVKLRVRNGEALSFDCDSVIITEKLAETLDISTGGSLTLENSDGKTAALKITGITENYVGSYVYIGSFAYKRAFGEFPEQNALLVKANLPDETAEDEFGSKLLECDGVANVTFTAASERTFGNLLTMIDILMIVILIAAGALAVTVLYNLTNINIGERWKELATLRVLGYHHTEVGSYIFREIIILNVIGTALGLLLGALLHRFVVLQADSVDMMFGRSVSLWSFLGAALATLVFSAVVDLIMYRKIRKIDMADSMKAVD